MEIIKISLISFMFCALGSKGMVFEWYQNLIDKLPEWLCKMTGGCYKCFSGQCALWYYLLVHFKDYNFIEHLFFISAVIFCSMIWNKFYCYLK